MMICEAILLLSATLGHVVCSSYELDTFVPSGKPFTSDVTVDFFVKGYSFGDPSEQMAACAADNVDPFCYVEDTSQKEIVIYANNVTAKYQTLKITDVNGVSKIYSLGPEAQTEKHIQVTDEKINGAIVPVSDFIVEAVVEAVPNRPAIKVYVHTTACDINGKVNCIQRYKATTPPNADMLRILIHDVTEEYNSVKCEGQNGYWLYKIHNEAPTLQFMQRVNNQIKTDGFQISWGVYDKCTVEFTQGFPEIGLLNEGICDENSPGCYLYKSGGGLNALKSPGIDTPTPVRLEGVGSHHYYAFYKPKFC